MLLLPLHSFIILTYCMCLPSKKNFSFQKSDFHSIWFIILHTNTQTNKNCYKRIHNIFALFDFNFEKWIQYLSFSLSFTLFQLVFRLCDNVVNSWNVHGSASFLFIKYILPSLNKMGEIWWRLKEDILTCFLIFKFFTAFMHNRCVRCFDSVYWWNLMSWIVYF